MTRYFSNSASAKALANSVVTLPALVNKSLPPASSIRSIRFAQSYMVMGICRLAIRSAISRTALTKCPMSSNSISLR